MTDHNMFTHEDINWDRLWQNARRKKGWGSKGAEEWDKKAASFAARNRTSPYVELLLRHLPLDSGMTVLDVGCGPGNLTLPLAKHCRRVTALDFSANMLAILEQEARTQHLENVTTHRLAWEDDWQQVPVAPHDLAIASRSLSVDDLRAAIGKLDAHASRYVFIADRISPTPFAPEAFSAVGRPFNSGPDYIYTLNILYSMGIHPNVTILELPPVFTYQDLDQAFLTYSWMIKELSKPEELALKDFLASRATANPDGTIAIARDHHPRWALIWWAKDGVSSTTAGRHQQLQTT